MVGFNFAPRNWAFCDGSVLPIDNYQSLFEILGTTFGGDGETYFRLPDLIGRVAMHPGQGPGLTSRHLGEKGGTDTVTLTEDQNPAHDHIFNIHCGGSNSNDPNNAALANSLGFSLYVNDNNTSNMAAEAVSVTGAGQAHDNLQPYLSLNFIIAMEGSYPFKL